MCVNLCIGQPEAAGSFIQAMLPNMYIYITHTQPRVLRSPPKSTMTTCWRGGSHRQFDMSYVHLSLSIYIYIHILYAHIYIYTYIHTIYTHYIYMCIVCVYLYQISLSLYIHIYIYIYIYLHTQYSFECRRVRELWP